MQIALSCTVFTIQCWSANAFNSTVCSFRNAIFQNMFILSVDVTKIDISYPVEGLAGSNLGVVIEPQSPTAEILLFVEI